MTTTPNLSVVICTHNPRPDYLGLTLDALRAQTLAREKWELLVIDNASREPLSGGLDLSWHGTARVIREETLGLTPARLRGIREARGDILVFVDDDNVLDPDYLAQALQVAVERPFLGSWSGQCRPRFQEPPPDWTKRYWGNLVIHEFDRDSWSNQPRLADTMPCGAGLCVLRTVARRYLALHETGVRSFQFDRTGSSLLSGGDNDLAACACDLDLGVGLIAALKVTHLIPPERLTANYLCRLAEGIHFSSTLLDAAWGINSELRRPIGLLVDWFRVMRIKAPHRNILRAAYRGRNRALRLLESKEVALKGNGKRS